MDGSNLGYRGWAGLRVPHVPSVAMPGYFSATPELPDGCRRCWP